MEPRGRRQLLSRLLERRPPHPQRPIGRAGPPPGALAGWMLTSASARDRHLWAGPWWDPPGIMGARYGTGGPGVTPVPERSRRPALGVWRAALRRGAQRPPRTVVTDVGQAPSRGQAGFRLTRRRLSAAGANRLVSAGVGSGRAAAGPLLDPSSAGRAGLLGANGGVSKWAIINDVDLAVRAVGREA